VQKIKARIAIAGLLRWICMEISVVTGPSFFLEYIAFLYKTRMARREFDPGFAKSLFAG
jgi:hypothetical protein